MQKIMNGLGLALLLTALSAGCETMDTCLDGRCASDSSASSSLPPEPVAIPTPPPENTVYTR